MRTPHSYRHLAPLAAGALLAALTAIPRAQTPPPPAKRLPPAGVTIPEAHRAELTAGTAALRHELDRLARELENEPAFAASRLPLPPG